MSKKQEALIRAIKSAQEAGGFLQKQLAAMACTSPGNICSALSGAGSMSVEKWRLLCEGLALDYDAIIAEAENTPAAEVQQEEPVRCESAAPVCEEIAPECESPVKISGGVSCRTTWSASWRRICATVRGCRSATCVCCWTTCGC